MRQDTYFVGTIKGVGKIYQQTVIDTHCSHVLAKLYLSKVPMTEVDVLNDREILGEWRGLGANTPAEASTEQRQARAGDSGRRE